MLDALITPAACDELLAYPRGRSLKLARRGLLPSITLPDGSLRIDRDALELALMSMTTSVPAKGGDRDN